MRKNDQILIWEAFEGSVSPGGPLGGGSKSSSSSQSSSNDSEESDSPGLMGLLAQILQGVEDGSIDEDDACEHLSMILSGEAEAMEDESPEEQDTEDEDEDYMEDEEDDDNEEQDDDEDGEDKKQDPSNEYRNSIRRYMPPSNKMGELNRKGKRPIYRGVTGTKRDTTKRQEGI